MNTLPKDFIDKANRNLNLNDYANKSTPVPLFLCKDKPEVDNQYILRMLVKSPETNGFKIPEVLDWLKPAILECDNIQRNNNLNNPYVYVTVRHGEVSSVTDDVWHVGGFSMRTPHYPEQGYFCSNCYSTEWQNKEFPIPADFDPFKHNLHDYVASVADDSNTVGCSSEVVYAFDPYLVHRRPNVPVGVKRTFWRISFIAIEIEDDSCTQNPLLPVKKYGREDIRKKLVKYI
jgi:hypothetical protein